MRAMKAIRILVVLLLVVVMAFESSHSHEVTEKKVGNGQTPFSISYGLSVIKSGVSINMNWVFTTGALVVFTTFLIFRLRRERDELDAFVHTCDTILQVDSLDQFDEHLKAMDEYRTVQRKPMLFMFGIKK